MSHNLSASVTADFIANVGEVKGAGHDGRFCVDALGQQVVFVLAHFGCNTTVRVYTAASVPLQLAQLAEALAATKRAAGALDSLYGASASFVKTKFFTGRIVFDAEVVGLDVMADSMARTQQFHLEWSTVFSLSSSAVCQRVSSASEGITCLIESTEHLTPAFIIQTLDAADVVYLAHLQRAKGGR